METASREQTDESKRRDNNIKKLNPEEIINNKNRIGLGGLNKKMIMYVALGLMGFLLLLPGLQPSRKKNEEAEIVKTGAVIAPDVLRTINESKKEEQACEQVPDIAIDQNNRTAAKPGTVKPPVIKEIKPQGPKSAASQPTNNGSQVPVRSVPYIETQGNTGSSYDALQIAATDASARTASMKPEGENAGGMNQEQVTMYAGQYRSATAPVTTFGNAQANTPTETTEGKEYKEWNDQINKTEFAGSPGQSTLVASAPRLPANTVYAGTIIPAVLVTGINTDLPGDIIAIVTENVYDNVTGKNILIPQGTKILANYNSSITWGQNRAQIVWTRLIRPDGFSVELGEMNGVDSRGYTGQKGRVDEHLLKVAGGIGIMALTSIITGQIEYTAKTINPAGAEILNNANENIEDVGTGYVNRAINVQPTITITPGTKVMVFVNTDILLPEVLDRGTATKYTLGG